MKGQLRINQLFAFVIVDDDGTEGVPGYYNVDTDTIMPMMGADMKYVEGLKGLALADPTFKGRKLTICRFGHREQIGTIDRTEEKPPNKLFAGLEAKAMVVEQLQAAIERDAAQTVALYRSMRVEELHRLRIAHTLDQAEAMRDDKPASVAFGAGRVALIDFVLKEKGDRG